MSNINASPTSEGHPDDCQLPLSDCAVCQENEFARLGGCVQQINQSITVLQEQGMFFEIIGGGEFVRVGVSPVLLVELLFPLLAVQALPSS
jgi:hypothetical protein